MLLSMAFGIFRRKVISDPELCFAAQKLKPRILDFTPDTVVYIEEGGEAFGLAIAKELGVPAMGIDIGYPLSRTFNSASRVIRTLTWPFKELVYKCASPSLLTDSGGKRRVGRVLLVDDSASSGRSIEIALASLMEMGVSRSEIKIAVFRCGSRARILVDYFETGEKVLFAGR